MPKKVDPGIPDEFPKIPVIPEVEPKPAPEQAPLPPEDPLKIPEEAPEPGIPEEQPGKVPGS